MSQKFWVVQQLSWRLGHGYCYDNNEDNGLPVGVFDSEKKAEVYCRTLEEEAWRELSPFQFFESFEDVAWLTDLDEDELVEKVKALGLPAPQKEQRESRWDDRLEEVTAWDSWWDQCSPEMTEEQRSAVWGLFKRLKFYQVVDTEEESE